MHTGLRKASRLLPMMALSALLTVAVPAAANASTAIRYVSLGDSYTAGPLIPDPTGNPLGCLRSTHNYPRLTSAAIGAASLTDVSCSGATTANMTKAQSVPLGTNPPQLSALSASTTVVTLGIGGNDIGFSSIIGTCTSLSVTDPLGDPCADHYTASGTDKIVAAINATGPKVATVLKEVHADAPNARIFVVGYPDILPNTGNGCFPIEPIAFGDVPFLRGEEKNLNRMLSNEAATNGAVYVDTYTPTIGHDSCQPPGTRWIEGEVPLAPAAPWHPNALGEKAMAGAVQKAVG